MLRLGTVPYLNALPLLDGLQDEPDVELVQAVPAELAPRLRAGELDLALVSSVELFREPALGWIAGPAITSEGPVESIRLFLRTPAREVRSLGLDTSSLSAAVLAQVCLQRFLGAHDLSLLPVPPQTPLADLRLDAVLRIGDPALMADPGPRQVLDLGQVWSASTGLPFVYALWLGRPGYGAERHAERLRRAAARGLQRRPALAARFAAAHGLDADGCSRYLHACIGYALGPREREGLCRFGRLAHDMGLVDRAELPPPLG